MNTPEQSRNNPISAIQLEAGKPTGEQPMELFLTDEHTEYYLTMKTGEDIGRGQLTGLLGWVLLGLLGIAIISIFQGEPKGAYMALGLGIPLFTIPFLWDVLRPLPLPALFNRRTREVYFGHNGVTFHTPWDYIQAVANEFQLIGPNIGSIPCASLEIRVWQFEHPENALMVKLGSPFGKTLELQKGLWEYIRSYMNNGPYFDEHGHHSEFDTFVKSQLAVHFKMSDSAKHIKDQIQQKNKASDGKNYLSGSDSIMLILELLLYPMYRIQELTYDIAKRRSRNRWPSLVTERLKADGPTTRLVDLEREKGVGV